MSVPPAGVAVDGLVGALLVARVGATGFAGAAGAGGGGLRASKERPFVAKAASLGASASSVAEVSGTVSTLDG